VPTAGCERIDATMGQIVIECPSSLHAYIVSFPRILEIAPRGCPVCAAGLKGHGCRHRWIVSLEGIFDVPIQRMRCPACRRTFSLLPRILLPLVSCARALRDRVRSLWVRGATKMAAVRHEIASRSASLSLSLSTLYRWAGHTD
jgi:transposase-like protein